MSKKIYDVKKNRKTATKTTRISIKKPVVAKSTSTKTTKNTKSSKTKKTVNLVDSCIIYVGHIAHGFYEIEMKKFFDQFGNVKRLKLFRSNKTNNSKGYAFIEFDEAEVANVVAETMNGYFLNERQLVSHVIPKEKHHEGMFLKPKKKASDKDNNDDGHDDKELEEEEEEVDYKKRAKKYLANQRKKQKKLETLGIDFKILMPTA